MQNYLDMLNYILDRGTIKVNRTGVDTISTFAYHFTHDMKTGFPLLTTKKIKWENIVIENLWFLSGSSKWDFLHKHGITFWDAWDEGNGQLPEAYGEYWRKYPDFWKVYIRHINLDLLPNKESWKECYFDQFRAIVEGLNKNRNNRRLVLTNWYPPSAHSAKLPPCHLLSVFNTQYDLEGNPNLCLHMTQRSCDAPIGVPFNIAGYAFLLSLVSHLTNIPPSILSMMLVDCHIYTNQIDAVKTQLQRTPDTLPKLIISDRIKTLSDIDSLIKDGTTTEIMDCFKLEGYNPQPFIKMPVAI